MQTNKLYAAAKARPHNLVPTIRLYTVYASYQGRKEAMVFTSRKKNPMPLHKLLAAWREPGR